jgi:hypothetical protein
VSATDIFLSYARQDRSAARIFAECFMAEGFSVWWDASLHSGETFDEVIEQRLRDAKAVVVLWSPRSVASRWVRAEATLADRRNKLAPAIIEPCDRPIIFELTHAAELSDWTGDRSDVRWQDFVQDLHRLVGTPSNAQSAAAAQPASPPQLGSNGPPAASPQPVSRQALRPGNDDVIVAGKPDREPSRTAFPSPAPAQADSLAEVHCLQLEGDDGADELIVVDSSGLKIGRTAPAGLILSHKSVSREHCMIGLANDELLVTDLNSTNGTYIDGQRISRTTILPVGSVVRLGEVSLKHIVCAAPEAIASAEADRAAASR